MSSCMQSDSIATAPLEPEKFSLIKWDRQNVSITYVCMDQERALLASCNCMVFHPLWNPLLPMYRRLHCKNELYMDEIIIADVGIKEIHNDGLRVFTLQPGRLPHIMSISYNCDFLLPGFSQENFQI